MEPNYTSAWDTMCDILQDAEEEFGEKFTVSEARTEWLRAFCEDIDQLIGETDAICLDFSVEEDDKILVVDVICPDIISQDGDKGVFFRMIRNCNAFSFSKAGDDRLKISFLVDGVFEAND